MPVTPDPVYSDTDLPKKTSVAVIGGGIIGTCTALELAERGIDVTLIEKGVITDAEFKQKLLEERAVYQRILNPTTQ